MIVSPLEDINNFFNTVLITDFLKVAIFIFLIFFAIFSLLIVRQVDLMSQTLITPVSPLVKAFSIILAGVSISLIFLMLGIL